MIGTPDRTESLLSRVFPFELLCHVRSDSLRCHKHPAQLDIRLMSSPAEFFSSICAHRVKCRWHHNRRPSRASFVIANWWKPLDKYSEHGERLIWYLSGRSQWKAVWMSGGYHHRFPSRLECLCLINNQSDFLSSSCSESAVIAHDKYEFSRLYLISTCNTWNVGWKAQSRVKRISAILRTDSRDK